MADTVFAADSTITVNDDSVAATAAGLNDAFARATPTITICGYTVTFPTTASDYTSVSALRQVIDRVAGVRSEYAVAKRVRTLFGQEDSAHSIRWQNQILFGYNSDDSDDTFNGVGRVLVVMNATRWSARLYYTIPYTPPQTALGPTAIEDQGSDIFITITDLVSLSVHHDRSILIEKFFYETPQTSVSAARNVAARYGRTLPGMAMDWIKAVALSVGAETIRIEDRWHGFQGLRSKELKEAARLWETIQYMLNRAERINPDRYNPSDPQYAKAYMERIRKGGYYGQFGFVNESVDVQDLVYVNAPFVDACL